MLMKSHLKFLLLCGDIIVLAQWNTARIGWRSAFHTKRSGDGYGLNAFCEIKAAQAITTFTALTVQSSAQHSCLSLYSV